MQITLKWISINNLYLSFHLISSVIDLIVCLISLLQPCSSHRIRKIGYLFWSHQNLSLFISDQLCMSIVLFISFFLYFFLSLLYLSLHHGPSRLSTYTPIKCPRPSHKSLVPHSVPCPPFHLSTPNAPHDKLQSTVYQQTTHFEQLSFLSYWRLTQRHSPWRGLTRSPR